MIFINKHFFTKQIFTIDKSGLKVDSRNLFDTAEYELSFELIGNKRKIQTSVNHGALIIGVFLFIIGILILSGANDELSILFISIALVCIVFGFTLRKRSIIIPVNDGTKIELYFTKRNKQRVLEFSDAVIEASNNYLLKKYSKTDPALPLEPQLDNIQFLWNRGIISEESYESLKDHLLGRNNKSNIGYGR